VGVFSEHSVMQSTETDRYIIYINFTFMLFSFNMAVFSILLEQKACNWIHVDCHQYCSY